MKGLRVRFRQVTYPAIEDDERVGGEDDPTAGCAGKGLWATL